MIPRRIETARLILRPVMASDAEWIAREIARPEVQRMLTSPPHPYRLDHAREWVAEVADNPNHRVIECASEPVGVVTCDAGDRHETLGYWLQRSAWGQGLMTEAAGAVLAAHFEAGAEQATSGYIIDNPASARVLTKLGFDPSGTVQRFCAYRGADVTIQKMRLTRARWHGLSRAG